MMINWYLAMETRHDGLMFHPCKRVFVDWLTCRNICVHIRNTSKSLFPMLVSTRLLLLFVLFITLITSTLSQPLQHFSDNEVMSKLPVASISDRSVATYSIVSYICLKSYCFDTWTWSREDIVTNDTWMTIARKFSCDKRIIYGFIQIR
jgi:hypothetical protein